MTRQKKTRKAPVGSVKKEKQPIIKANTEKSSVKRDNGNKPGTRQQESQKKTKPASQSQIKDPRLGNKTPIALIPAKAKVVKPKTAKTAAITPIRKVDNKTALLEEFNAIEQDIYLQDLLDKQDDDLTLTAEELSYISEKMARHQELQDILGINDDPESHQKTDKKTLTDDDLWNKFDNTDFSEYE